MTRSILHQPSSMRAQELLLRDLLALDSPALEVAYDSLKPFVGARGAMPIRTPYGMRYIVTEAGFRPHPWELLIDLSGVIGRARGAGMTDDLPEAA